jgi:hypothetical protein
LRIKEQAKCLTPFLNMMMMMMMMRKRFVTLSALPNKGTVPRIIPPNKYFMYVDWFIGDFNP